MTFVSEPLCITKQQTVSPPLIELYAPVYLTGFFSRRQGQNCILHVIRVFRGKICTAKTYRGNLSYVQRVFGGVEIIRGRKKALVVKFHTDSALYC